MKQLSKKLTVILTLTMILGTAFFKDTRAQSFVRDGDIHEIAFNLAQNFTVHWDEIDKIVFSKHRDNGSYILSMHVSPIEEDEVKSPVIEIDFKKRYKGDYIFGLQFKCHEITEHTVKPIYKAFYKENKDLKELSRDENIIVRSLEELPFEHRYLYVNVLKVIKELSDFCGLPAEI